MGPGKRKAEDPSGSGSGSNPLLSAANAAKRARKDVSSENVWNIFSITLTNLVMFGLRFGSLKIAKFGASAKRKCMFWSLCFATRYMCVLMTRFSCSEP